MRFGMAKGFTDIQYDVKPESVTDVSFGKRAILRLLHGIVDVIVGIVQIVVFILAFSWDGLNILWRAMQKKDAKKERKEWNKKR